MKIIEIEGKNVKIGKTSITVKNDYGKTCGIVKNICKFMDIQPNKQIDYFKTIKQAGLWNNDGKIDHTVIVDGEIYYLNNTNGDNIRKEYETEKWKEKCDFLENCKKFVHVINVSFIS